MSSVIRMLSFLSFYLLNIDFYYHPWFLCYPFSNVSYVLRLPLLVVMLDPQNCLCLLFQVLFLVLPVKVVCFELNLRLYSFTLLDYSILNGFCFLLDAIISLDIPFLAFVYSIILMISTYLVVPLLFIMKTLLLLRFFFPPMRNLYMSVTCIACVCHIVFLFFFFQHCGLWLSPYLTSNNRVFTMLSGLKSLLR